MINGDSLIFQYFRQKYRNIVLAAHIIPDLTALDAVLTIRMDHLKRLGFYVDEKQKTGKRAMVKIGNPLLFWKRTSVDAIKYYKEKIQEADLNIKRLREKQFKEHTGVATITFTDFKMLPEIISSFKSTKGQKAANKK